MNTDTDSDSIAVPENNVGESEIPVDTYNEIYTTPDIDLSERRNDLTTPTVHVIRCARPLVQVRKITLNYYCSESNQNIQWRPVKCRSKSREMDCSCQHADKCPGGAYCICGGVDFPCVMYCNGYKLRWVYSSEVPYLGAIPIYRCKHYKCSGGAFTSNYDVSPDINLNIISDITAHGGQLGKYYTIKLPSGWLFITM